MAGVALARDLADPRRPPRLAQTARSFYLGGELMERRLTLKQHKFVAYLLGTANGNGTMAARLAGYRGDDRQLGVQASMNRRNPVIRKIISETLDALVEPSLKRLAEGLDATKRRAFLTRDGEIVYADPEPDFRVRTTTANQILDRSERSSTGYASGSDDVITGHDDGAELQMEMAGDAKTEGGADDGIVAQLDPADRVLFGQATKIEAELAEVDRELDDGGHGTEQ